MSNGVLYIGTTDRYFEEAKISNESLKHHNNTIESAIITSKQIANSYDGDDFDSVITLGHVHDDLRDKIRNIPKSPFQRTLYLDHDTFIKGDITPAFDLLDRVDVAAAIAPIDPVVTIESVPECFPELNTGVLLFKSSTKTDELFDRWAALHHDQIEHGRPHERIPGKNAEDMDSIRSFGRLHGQPPFREALYETDVQFSVLPREYNFRGYGASAFTQVKIVHDRRRTELSDIINEKLGKRVYTGDKLSWRGGDCIDLDKI